MATTNDAKRMQGILERLVELWDRADWRILMGIVLTTIWAMLGMIYLSGAALIGRTILDIPLEDLGSFLEGAFAPLAFLWLVIGLFVQQKELADNTEVLRQTAMHSAQQTQAIAATELNARQETFFKIAENVKRQLGGIAGLLFASSMVQAEDRIVSQDEMREMFHSLSLGDTEIFVREFMMMDAEIHGGYPELFYGTEIRRRHAENYRRSFERLVELAQNCDIDGIIQDSLEQTAHGIFYRRLKESDPLTQSE